jgi:hypothetical protein
MQSIKHTGLILIFLQDPLRECDCVHGAACFANVASATFTGNATDTLCRLLRVSFVPVTEVSSF